MICAILYVTYYFWNFVLFYEPLVAKPEVEREQEENGLDLEKEENGLTLYTFICYGMKLMLTSIDENLWMSTIIATGLALVLYKKHNAQ